VTQESEREPTPPWDATRVYLTSKDLTPGVFAVMPDDVFTKDHVATKAGFVIGEPSVLVVEIDAERRCACVLLCSIGKDKTPHLLTLSRRPPIMRRHRDLFPALARE
jgi:hypothetical protein